MKTLHIWAFGKLRMQYGGVDAAPFPTRHAEALLGYLLLNQQTAHSREKLAGILWPSTSSKKGRARLSTTLWQLRCLFEQMGATAAWYVETTRERVAFRPQRPFQFDVDTFRHHLTQAQFATTDAQYEQHLRTAVDLHSSSLCEGVYDEWCLIEREHLARLYLRTAGQLISCYLKRQAYRRAIELGQTILQEDPLREEVHRALMDCYWKMGRRARAARQFHICAGHLQQELDILPMPETIDLYRQIVESRLDQPALHRRDAATQAQLQATFAEFIKVGRQLNALLNQTSAPV